MQARVPTGGAASTTPGVAGMVSPGFAEVLKKHRDLLNAKVAATRKAGDGVDALAFLEFLREGVGPMVEKLEREAPERVERAVLGLFDVALELFGLHLLGPGAKRGEFREAWLRILPAAAQAVGQDAVRVAGSVSNAVSHLCATAGAKPGDWVERMAAVAASCRSATELLECGMVMGWRCGLPQYRRSAMGVARRLPWALAGRALGLRAGVSEAEVAKVIEGVEREPWVAPERMLDGGREMRVMGCAGEFRGFGGPFEAVPRVTAAQGEIFATDGRGTWQVVADVFNAVLLRVDGVPAKDIWSAASVVHVAGDGKVSWGKASRTLPELAGAISFASTADTLAVTLKDSYRIYLVGRGVS